MNKRIHIDLDGRKPIPVEVDILGDAARARFLAHYPGAPPSPDDVDSKHIDWFVEVTEWATQYNEHDIRSLTMGNMLDFCSEVVQVALQLEEPSGPTTIPADGWMVVTL